MGDRLEIPPYSGWKPRAMRRGNSKHESDRGTKRSRLGNRLDRAFYKSCKSHKRNPDRWMKICTKVNWAVYNRATITGAVA
jgi:hypothetical protein